MAARERQDWAKALEALAQGDRRALLALTRLINSFFVRWNAYDFRDDWDDLIQEVLMAGLRAQSEDRIRERAHTYGFLKTVARNKFVDRLKKELRAPSGEQLPWEEVVDRDAADAAANFDADLSRDVQAALASLDDKRRRSVLAIYVEGRTLSEAVEATGIPLGSLRRYLREGLAELQRALSSGSESSPPGPGFEKGSAPP